jgi:hypothetical protein
MTSEPSPSRDDYALRAEDLAYWFFRLNGCLTLVNFVVHDEHENRQRTEVDMLAVRFPHRLELAMSDTPMQDHPVFDSDGKIDLIIAEVKTKRCQLNGPWTKPARMNMHRILHAVGAFPDDVVPNVAAALYRQCCYVDAHYRVRLFALGARKNSRLGPEVVQLTWDDVLQFIYQRFESYFRIKTRHHQWDACGQLLFNLVMEHTAPGGEQAFVEEARPGWRREREGCHSAACTSDRRTVADPAECAPKCR